MFEGGGVDGTWEMGSWAASQPRNFCNWRTT